MRLRSLSDLFRDVIQLGYVTEDVDAAAAWLESELGTTRCRARYESAVDDVVVDGARAAEWVIDVALVNAGPTNFEIIRPVRGAVDLYRDAIRPGAPATFHHIGVRVADFDEATAVVAASGRSWKQHGAMDDGTRFGYVDLTTEVGHYLEVMQLGPQLASYFDFLEQESSQ